MMKFTDFEKKPSKAAFKQTLRGKIAASTGLGLLSWLLSSRLVLPDFGRGFLLGFAISCFFASLYFSATLRHADKFNRYYVSYYDERNQHIRGLAMQLTSWLVVGVLIVLVLLYAFWQIELPYLVLVISLLYTALLGGVLLKWLLGKIL